VSGSGGGKGVIDWWSKNGVN